MDELLAELADAPADEKGDRGRVGIVAGSVDQTGPPAIVGKAALRTGSDLAKVLTSERVLTAVAGYSENLIVHPYAGDHLSADSSSRVRDLGEWSDVLVVGPGLSEPDPAAVRRILEEATVPVVVDADAIEPALEASFGEAVFTPDGEEADGIREAHGSLEAFSARTGAVVVSTGATDDVYAPEGHRTYETGTPAMTVGGTGDALCGIVASLLGQGLDPLDGAALGARTAGAAGELAAEEYGNGIVATDVVERIPDAMAV